MPHRIVVGKYEKRYNDILGLYLPEQDIFLFNGLEKHVSKKHVECLPYIEQIPDIISHPDYIGKHPNIPFSVEFIKRFDKNILVAVQLDEKDGYYYVSNLYDISSGKIAQKLFSGRLERVP